MFVVGYVVGGVGGVSAIFVVVTIVVGGGVVGGVSVVAVLNVLAVLAALAALAVVADSCCYFGCGRVLPVFLKHIPGVSDIPSFANKNAPTATNNCRNMCC